MFTSFLFLIVRNHFKFADVSPVLVHQMFHMGKHLSMCFKQGLFSLEISFFSLSPAKPVGLVFGSCNPSLIPPMGWGEFQSSL